MPRTSRFTELSRERFPRSFTRSRVNHTELPVPVVFTIDDVDHFRQMVVGIRADYRYALELSRAPRFAVDSQASFPVGAIRQAVSG